MIQQQYLLRTNPAQETPRWVVIRAGEKDAGTAVAWFFTEADAVAYVAWKNAPPNPLMEQPHGTGEYTVPGLGPKWRRE